MVSATIWMRTCAKWASAISPSRSECRPLGRPSTARAAAYDQALTAGEEPLARALCKNILNGAEIEKARQLAFYAGAAIAALTGLDDATVQSGAWRFPSPARVGVQQ